MQESAIDAIGEARVPKAWPVPGKPVLFYGAYDAADIGIEVREWFVSGEADAYTASGELPEDGRWNPTVTGTAAFTTRILTMLPDPARFNGTVVVEWLNVTGGLDSPPVWLTGHRHFVREGYGYVAVSAQKIGVDGGSGIKGVEHVVGVEGSLKGRDAARYADLDHPGDIFAYDIFSQIGRLLRGPQSGEILPGMKPQRVIAAGKAQSASMLTTYVNAVDRLARVYDGFFIHSRLGAVPALEGELELGNPQSRVPLIKFRPDLRVPVLALENEGDLLDHPEMMSFRFVRQPDGEHLRIWELAGAAHADSYSVGAGEVDTGLLSTAELAAAHAPFTNVLGTEVATPINFAPQQHYVAKAAFEALVQWVATDRAPPPSPKIEFVDVPTGTLALDDHGMAKGGIRTPWVDVPTARLAAMGDDGTIWAAIFGTTEFFSPSKLNALYPGGKQDYLGRFEAALDQAIDSGFMLAADRDEAVALANAMYPVA